MAALWVLRVLVLAACGWPALALAQASDGTKSLHWWEAVTGILAIPAAIIAMVYSVVFIQKTRIEARKNEAEIRKLELEIKEKTLALTKPDEGSAAVLAPISELADISVRSQAGNLIIIRFIFLLLIITLVNVIDAVVRMVGGFLMLLAMAVFGSNFNGAELPEPVIMAVAIILERWSDVVSVAVLILFGLPILRDAGALLGVPVRPRSLPLGRWLGALRRAGPSRDTRDISA